MNAIIGVQQRVLEPINAKIKRNHRSREWRPVGVAIVQCGGFILLIQSRASKSWNFVQGGIEKGEGVVEGTLREVWEEVCILPAELEVVDCDSWTQIKTSKRSRREFTEGSLYVFLHLVCLNEDCVPTIIPKPDEVGDYLWLPRFQVPGFLKTHRPPNKHKKTEAMVAAVKKTWK